MSDSDLRIAPGVAVTPERAGWRNLWFERVRVGAGGSELGDPRREEAVVILEGGLSVDIDGRTVELPGRHSVWDGLPWALYLPAGSRVEATPIGETALVAVAASLITGRGGAAAQPVVIGPEDVRVEIRGAGNATRQVNHIITPDFPADRLEVVEIYTPSGNWSSWPPHKHDTDDMPNEAVLEEVYFYAFRRPEAWGIQRLYRADGSRDLLWAVRDGETVMVTDGYHPFVATHGDDAYYLNALAGDVRTMACSFDPALDHVRDAWASMDPDPRVPLVR
ncbi:MAG: 5-deoxy-glucuronate isomerase [Chloroflexi bacterium]|nr:5-deoxy-glucuronate isomerase [Chloroflexota bacterium]